MGTLCVSGAALFKAGANVSTSLVEADYDYAILQAESYIYDVMRNNLSGVYSSLNPAVKYILENVCSDLAGMYLINYDMGGYNSTEEASTMIDVLNSRVLLGLSMLRDKKTQDFINGA